MITRAKLFWCLDKLRGSSVSKHLEDIVSIMSQKDKAIKEHYVQNNLQRILTHTSSSTVFYNQIELERGIEGFPVVNKNIIRNNFADFLSNKYNETTRVAAVTSGSTGTPFKVYHNKSKKNRNTADTIFFASKAGYELGDKLFYFKIWSDYNRKKGYSLFAQNIIPIDVLNLKTNANEIVRTINNTSEPLSILGYVSALETLCRILEKDNSLSERVKIKSVITMSEGLSDYLKIKGEALLKCPVLSRYSNIENGIIAQQTLESSNEFIINEASYYIEIMDIDSDTVLKDGNLGRIIVTDFYNEAMPLVRYDTGDVGVKKVRVINGINVSVLSKIEGRKLDQIFNTKGELVSSYIVYKNMWKYTELEQYQLIQKTEKGYEMKLCTQGKFNRESELRQEFLTYLGDDAQFEVSYVSDIPLLNSGKRKKVVNLMNI